MSAPHSPPVADARCMGPAELERLRITIIRHFAEHLYHKVGVREICRDAQVSPKTVYKYFGSKEELMLACVEPDLQALTDLTRAAMAGAASPRDALRAVAQCQFRFYAAHPVVARVVFLNLPEAYWMEQRSPAQMARDALINQALIESTKGAAGRADADAALVLDVAAGAVRRLVVRWLVEGQRGDLEAQGDAFLALMEGVLGD